MKKPLLFILLLASNSLLAQVNTSIFTIGGFGIGSSCEQFQQTYQNNFTYDETHFSNRDYLHYKMKGEVIIGCDKNTRTIQSIQYYLGHPTETINLGQGFKYAAQDYNTSGLPELLGTPDVVSKFNRTTRIWDYKEASELTVTTTYNQYKDADYIVSIQIGSLQ